MVSLTTFRSLYVKRLQQERHNQNVNEHKLSYYRKNRLNRKKQHRIDDFGNSALDQYYLLPSIASATLTGMRTFIGGLRVTSPQPLSKGSRLLLVDEGSKEEDPSSIWVVREFDVHRSIRDYV